MSNIKKKNIKSKWNAKKDEIYKNKTEEKSLEAKPGKPQQPKRWEIRKITSQYELRKQMLLRARNQGNEYSMKNGRELYRSALLEAYRKTMNKTFKKKKTDKNEPEDYEEY